MSLSLDEWKYVAFNFEEDAEQVIGVLSNNRSPLAVKEKNDWGVLFEAKQGQAGNALVFCRYRCGLACEAESISRYVAEDDFGFTPSCDFHFEAKEKIGEPERDMLYKIIERCVDVGLSFVMTAGNKEKNVAGFAGGYDAQARRMYVGKGLNELLCEFAPANI